MPKNFLAFNAGTTVDKDGNQSPYAFHVEANVTREPFYSDSDEDRQSFCRLNVALGRNPWLLFGADEAQRESDNDNINADRPFATLVLYGELADKMKDAPKGAKVLFSGRPRRETFKRRDGTESESVSVYVDSIMYLSSRVHDGDGIREDIPCKANVYTRRNGESVVSQWGTLTGIVKAADDVTQSNGQNLRGFRVDLAIPALQAAAIVNGELEDADYGDYKTLSCTVWGNRATHLDSVLRKGNVLALTGTLNVRESERNGRTLKYTGMNVRELSVMRWAPVPSSESNPSESSDEPDASEPAEQAPNYAKDMSSLSDDDDMDLPF